MNKLQVLLEIAWNCNDLTTFLMNIEHVGLFLFPNLDHTLLTMDALFDLTCSLFDSFERIKPRGACFKPLQSTYQLVWMRQYGGPKTTATDHGFRLRSIPNHKYTYSFNKESLSFSIHISNISLISFFCHMSNGKWKFLLEYTSNSSYIIFILNPSPQL